ncbi:MAG: PP2C family protein-serine/threonine phosphatase [Ktedonobacterales bacterium]
MEEQDQRSEGAPDTGDRPVENSIHEAQTGSTAEQVAVIDSMQDAPAPASAAAPTTGTETPEAPATGEAPQAPATSEAQPDATPAAAERPEPLAEGARAGAYTIVCVLATNAEETRYLAREVAESGESGQPPADTSTAGDAYVTLIERAEGQLNSFAQRALLGLRHPRLLAARSAFSAGGRSYLALDTLVSPEGVPALTASDGARLDAVAALTAGAGLADALAYLHRNDIAHLHVSPDVLVIHNGRAYLAGLETAEYVGALLDDAGALFARDANFLARSLGELAGLPTEAPPDEPPSQAALRSIVGYGAAGGFTAPADLAGACTLALQNAGSAPSLLIVEHPQERLLLEVGAATTVGLVRSENQDAYSTFICDLRDDVTKEAPFAVFIVADGMGGEARGEVASRIAARMVLSELVSTFAVPALTRPAIMEMSEVPTAVLRAVSMKGVATGAGATSPENGNDTHAGSNGSVPEDELHRALKRAVAAANRQVRELASQLGQATGTTLTALVSLGSRAALAHLGDSRAYLLRGDLLAQLTEDHSVLARLQAIDHPLLSDPDVFVPRNMLYRSLGQEDDPNPDLVSLTLAVGDRVLICSDGLWDEIEPDALAQTLATAATPQQCAEQLVALANATGGHDNSTALVVFVQSAAEDSATRAEGSPAESLSAAPEETGEQPSE